MQPKNHIVTFGAIQKRSKQTLLQANTSTKFSLQFGKNNERETKHHSQTRLKCEHRLLSVSHFHKPQKTGFTANA